MSTHISCTRYNFSTKPYFLISNFPHKSIIRTSFTFKNQTMILKSIEVLWVSHRSSMREQHEKIIHFTTYYMAVIVFSVYNLYLFGENLNVYKNYLKQHFKLYADHFSIFSATPCFWHIMHVLDHHRHGTL